MAERVARDMEALGLSPHPGSYENVFLSVSELMVVSQQEIVMNTGLSILRLCAVVFQD